MSIINYEWKNDFETIKNIININKKKSKEIYEVLVSKNIFEKNFKLLHLGLIGDVYEKISSDYKEYFPYIWDKYSWRWWWYYFLFWDYYKLKQSKEVISTFEQDMKKYFNFLIKLSEDKEAIYFVLDNLRNLVLYYFYINNLIYKNTKYDIIWYPFKFLKDYDISSLNNKLINLYNFSLEWILNYFLWWTLNYNIKEKIEYIVNEIYDFYFSKEIFNHKWKKWKFFEVFWKNWVILNQFFNNLNRNFREEDNLYVIILTLLQWEFDIIFNNSEDLKNKIKKTIKKIYKNSSILSVAYWWIEYAFVANYFWIPSWIIFFSQYNFSQKNYMKDFDKLVYKFGELKNNIVLFDDNVQSWNTIAKMQAFIQVNWYKVLPIVWRHVYLSKKQPWYIREAINWENLKWVRLEVLNSLVCKSFFPFVKMKNKSIMHYKNEQLKKQFWKTLIEYKNG